MTVVQAIGAIGAIAKAVVASAVVGGTCRCSIRKTEALLQRPGHGIFRCIHIYTADIGKHL